MNAKAGRGQTCNSRLFYIDKAGLEHTFGRLESLRSDFDYSAVWELG